MGCAGSKPVASSTVVPETSNTKAHSPTTHTSTAASTNVSTETSSSSSSSSGATTSPTTETKTMKPAPSKFNLLHKLPSFVSVKSLETRYTLGKVLGRGGFGEVREAIRKSDGKRVAVKTISKLKFAGEDERQNMLTEVELMQRVVGHRNVVELYEWEEDRANFYMVVEICTGGELMDRIAAVSHFSEKIAAEYFQQMATGLKYIHDHLIVHRDLKPENFLLESPSPDAKIKITDFGLSCAIPDPDGIITEACGSAYYIAPEVFTRKYGRAADVWSIGVILYLLIAGTVPFGASANSEVEVYKSIQRDKLVFGPEWNNTTAAVRELVSGLLEKDPTKRYTLEQALAHPWVSGNAASDAPIDKSLVQSMLNFNVRNKFKKQALRLVASAISAADIANLRAAFHKMDQDNSGAVSYAEMTSTLKEMGINMEDNTIQQLMRNIDTDGDGKISYEEFVDAVVDRQLVNQQNAMWWAFCEYDADGDGKITAEELKLVMKNESPERIAKYIAEYDLDKDGTINYEEFMRMLLPKDLKFKISKF